MRKGLYLFLVVALLAMTLPTMPVFASEAKIVTVKGEVIDTACYFAKGAKGERHKKCAQMCVKGGIPAGLLAEDGTIYILNEDHSDERHAAAFEKIKERAAEVVTVKGALIEKSGVKMLFVHEVSGS